MKLVSKFNKLFLTIVMWGVLFLPIFACQATSRLASVWAEDKQPPVEIYMPIDTDGLANLGTFFLYLLIIIGGIFALSSIVLGALKMYTASGNEDNHHGGQHAFITGIISFVVAIVLYFSLDYVLVIVKELA